MAKRFGAELTGRIDAVFAEWDSLASPGCALGVYLAGEIAYSRGYGMANLEHDIQITPDSIFHVASISKQFAAHCIVLLAKEGKLSLDDDVRDYVPEVPDYGRRITIRHLIHHTSGLRDQWELLRLAGWRDDDLITDDDVLEIVPRQRALNFPPGEQYFYSNTGYTLLGVIVRRVSGRSLRRYAHERIFEPLGMTRTHFHDDHNEIVPGRTHGYEPGEQGVGHRISNPVFDTTGATSLHTTVNDLFRWDQYLERWLPDTANRQYLERALLNDGMALSYGCGLRYTTRHGVETIGHSGADAGYRAHFIRVPEHRLGIAVLCNLGTMMPGSLVDAVLEILIADHLGGQCDRSPDIIGLEDERLADLAGVYRGRRTGAVVEVEHEDGGLKLPGIYLTALDPVAGDRFVTRTRPPIELRFDTDEEDGALRMVIEEVDSFERMPAFDAGAVDLDDYVGVYFSDELGVDYEFSVDDGALRWRQRRFDARPLRPVLPDVFTQGRFWFEFQRDDGGAVAGFTVSSMRARRVAFERRR